MITNPLRDPRDRRIPRVAGPCVLVLFGVTGDLSRKKLMPAIYDLANRGLLPPGFALTGFARRDWGDGDFEDLARKAAQNGARTTWHTRWWLCSQFGNWRIYDYEEHPHRLRVNAVLASRSVAYYNPQATPESQKAALGAHVCCWASAGRSRCGCVST